MPRVSIGLPVYNGENYLKEAIDSILNQTFEDFELIISDNASTDGTERICREFALKDKRVRYSRNDVNIGASGNYSKVFNLSSGEYFKWAAHDDICLPDYLKVCIRELDNNPSVVLCHSMTASIDQSGTVIKEWRVTPEFGSPDPLHRFQNAIHISKATYLVWGVIRRSELSKTRLLGNFTWHDRPLLSSLSLFGKFVEVPHVQFLLREHGSRSIRVYDWRRPREAIAWYDPDKAGKLTFPTWRLFYEHLAGIHRAPISIYDRIRCYLIMIDFISNYKRELKHDLILAMRHLPGVKSEWVGSLDKTAAEIFSVIPRGETFIFVDEETLETEIFGDRATIPFLEKDGLYWGNPPDDEVAIQELTRLRNAGANFIVIAWPAFWWFDHYREFHNYLNRNHTCIIKTDRIVVFDLRV